MNTILLIDDDAQLANLLSQYFSRYDLELISATHPKIGIDLLQQNTKIDLILLDVMLPDMDGFEVCKRIRQTDNTPIIMLTGRGDVTDRVVGLELGADDYLPKPFEPRELVARIHAIIKRVNPNKLDQQEWRFGELLVDKNNAVINGRVLNLTHKELELLILFVKNVDTYLSRNDIMNALSGVNADYFSRSIDVLISRLRQKLKPLDYIKTARSKGYRFVSEL